MQMLEGIFADRSGLPKLEGGKSNAENGNKNKNTLLSGNLPVWPLTIAGVAARGSWPETINRWMCIWTRPGAVAPMLVTSARLANAVTVDELQPADLHVNAGKAPGGGDSITPEMMTEVIATFPDNIHFDVHRYSPKNVNLFHILGKWSS